MFFIPLLHHLLLIYIVFSPPPPPPPPHLDCFPLKRPKGQNQAYKAKLKCDGLILDFWSFRGKTIEEVEERNKKNIEVENNKNCGGEE